MKSLTPFLKEHWQGIRVELLNDAHKPEPVRRVEMPKPDGGVRLLGIPTVPGTHRRWVRLIQQALLQAGVMVDGVCIDTEDESGRESGPSPAGARESAWSTA